MSEKVYLNTSVYNRPFDEQKQARIWLETLAFSVILQLLENQELELITSSALAYESSRNPHRQRREWVNRIAKWGRQDHHAQNAIWLALSDQRRRFGFRVHSFAARQKLSATNDANYGQS